MPVFAALSAVLFFVWNLLSPISDIRPPTSGFLPLVSYLCLCQLASANFQTVSWFTLGRRMPRINKALLTSIQHRFTLFSMTAVTVSSKYQIVIPREARQKLGISSGTRLQAIPEASGLRLVKEPSIDELRGLLRGMPVDDAEIRNEWDRTLP